MVVTMTTFCALLWTLIGMSIPGGQCAVRSQLKERIKALSRLDLDREPFSLTFVFDTTSSMLDDLHHVKTATTAILTDLSLQQDLLIENYILVPFHDKIIGPAEIKSSVSDFERALKDLYIEGGGDCPESSIGGIKMALEVSHPKSFIFVFTDAPPKDVQKMDDVVDLVQATQSKVVFILTEGCNDDDPRFEDYHKIAVTSKGDVFPLKDKHLVKPILNFIHVSIQSRQVSLLYKIGVLNSTTFSVPVDSCLQDLLLTVTSEDGEREITGVDVYSPSGIRFDERVVDVKTAKVIKVESPAHGQWNVHVSTGGTYTIQIGGRSDCDFDPAFVYSLTPSSFYRRPAAGKLTYIMMNATRPSYQTAGEHLCNCTGAHVSSISLLQLNGDEIQRFSMDWDVEQFFQVDANVSFRAPIEPFLVKTSGRDENNLPFQRISGTMVPGSPGPPVYFDIGNTEFWETEGNPLVLPCPYRTIVSARISWRKDGSVLSDGSRYVTNSDGRLLILSTSRSDAGQYQCQISSSEGNTSGQLLQVNIGTFPVIVSLQDVSAEPGSDAKFICRVEGIPRPKVAWLFGDRIKTSEKTGDSLFRISNVRLSDMGPVTCIATNKAGETNKTAKLKVGSIPQVIAPFLLKGPSDQTVLVSQTVTMQCVVGGSPKPTITWKHKGIILERNSDNLTKSGETLVIRNTQLSNGGKYRCIVKNDKGRVIIKTKAFLTVIDPPRVVTTSATVLGILHQTISLVASVFGYPVPSLTWYNGGNSLPEDHRFTMHGNGTLTIQNIQLRDEGNYTLMASNEGGNDSATIHLTVNYAPYFVSAPASVSVIAGKRGVLECSGNGIPTPLISWSKMMDGIPQHLPGDGSQLIFDAVQPSDAGTYSCTLHNIFGQVTAAAYLNVIVPPLIIPTETTVVIPIHSTAYLHCNATGIPIPKITWLKNWFPLVSDPYKVSVLASGSLRIHNSTKTDIGNYHCVALNIGGHDSRTIYLDVHFPPHFISVPTSETLLIGSRLEWRCEATGNPKPSVTWMKNGQKLESNLDTLIMNNGTRLTVTNVDPSQSGQYTCKANNSMGEDSTSVVLFVIVPPRILTTVSHVAGLLHSEVLIPCQSEGIPNPGIEWKRNGSPLDNLHKYVIFDNGTLRIHSLLESDGSIYECHAVNMAGNISRDITLDVHVPASVTSLVNHEVLLGRNLSLTCFASGNPQPTIAWYKDTVLLSGITGVELRNDNTTFVIRETEQRHAGRYTCQAVNVVTDMRNQKTVTVQSSSEVIILVPPRVSVNASVMVVSRGDVVSVQCQATGIPTPHIQWIMSNRSRLVSVIPVTSIDGTAASTLRLINAQPSDSGEIECSAANKVGAVYVAVRLDVQFAPVVLMFPSNQTVVSQSTVRWRCTAEGKPSATITWSRNGEHVDGTPSLLISHDGSELTLRNVSRSDSGEYSCTATNDIGMHTVSATLEVHVGAKIVSDIDMVEGLIESAALLPCVAYGHPSPQVEWQREGMTIGTIPPYNVLPNGTLRIDNLQLANDGLYRCVASNVVGNDSKTVQLNVHYGPVIVKSPLDMEVLVGSTVTFMCKANGNPPASISWFGDGVAVADGLISDNGTALTVRNARPKDSITYTCAATNTVNDLGRWIVLSTSAAAHLRVIVPPHVQTNTSVVVLKDHSVVLVCMASGIPAPSLRWMKDNKEIDGSADGSADLPEIDGSAGLLEIGSADLRDEGQYSYSVIPTATDQLEIVFADLRDEGQYTCIGENKGGQASSTVTVDVHFPPFLSVFPSNRSMIVNGNVTWRCRATADPEAKVTWQKDGINMLASDAISISRDGGELTVLNLRPEDAGRYTCIASNYIGSVHASAHLLVIVPPSITSTVTQVEGLLGSTMYLPCSSRGIPDPVIIWYRRNAPVSMSDMHNYIHANGTLQIHNLSLSDADVYRCEAFNDGGRESLSITADVHFAPYVKASPENFEVLVGQNASFNCSVSGNPQPVVRWYHREAPVTSDSMRLHVSDDHTLLTVVGTQPEDAGLIICQAENTVIDLMRKITMTTQSSAVLTVNVPPEMTSNTSTVVVSKGDSVSLHCQATGIPSPIIRLFKGSDEATPTSIRTSTTSVGIVISSSELHLMHVGTEDAGQYVCRATNKAGSSNTTMSLDVQFSPVFVTVPSDLTVISQSTVAWLCVVTANPSAAITWSKDGKRLDDALDVVISDDGSELTLINVSRLDAGQYSCTATNDIGINKTSAKLEVHVGVKIVSDIDVVEGLLGSAALLPCIANGHPSPQIEWQRSGISVGAIFPNGTLRIDNLKQSDSGFYQCVASNLVGNDSKSVQLNVHYGPSIVVPPSDAEVLVGSTATFMCEASGNPPASISWSRDGVAVADDFVSNNGTVLTVDNVQPRDSVTYTCTSTNTVNDLGRWSSLSTNASAHLRVIVPPQVQTDTSVVVVKGHSVVLTCVASGIPTPSLRWMKDNKETDVSADQLEIVAADLRDEGRYMCIGENKGGQATSTVTVDVHFSPVLNVFPSNQRIVVNGNVTWRCRATADPAAKVTWQKDGIDILESNAISVNRDGGELTVLNLRPEDAGRYMCVATNYIGSVNASAHLLVIVPPSITSTVTQVDGLLGSTMYLPCSSRGIPDPVITWYLRNAPVSRSDTSKYSIHANGTLQVHNVSLSDADVYTCEASNEGGREFLSIATDVHFAPTVKTGPEDREVLIGQNVSFSCSVSGNPPPIVRWYHHEAPVTNGSMRLHVDDDQTLLTVVGAQPEDAGLLACQAENIVTDVTREITLTAQWSAMLTVIVPPEVTSNTPVVVVSKGDSVSLHCQAAGIPRPVIRMFKGTDEVSLTSNRTATTTLGMIISSSGLHLMQVETDDAGQYLCSATNKAGSSNTTISLDVQFSPVFVNVPSDQTVIAQSTVAWRCVVTANPSATITWSKDGGRLDDAPNAMIAHDGSELTLTNVSRLDVGEYSCTATNNIGINTVSAKLEVHVGVKIVSDVDVVEALLNSTALLPCGANGHPSPQIEWQRGGTSVGAVLPYNVLPNGTLRIDDLEQADSGLYRCVASNVVGNDSKTIQLDVHYGPSIVTSPGDARIVVGSTATFVCEANGNPPASITWSRNRVAVADGLVSENGTVLTVRNAQPRDSGTYTCTATNTVNDLGRGINLSTSVSARLRVIVPPVIASSDEEVDALLGSIALLPCSATGIPTPRIRWQQQLRYIVNDEKHTILANGTLRVRQLNLTDATTYTCVASNRAGEDRRNVTVDVHYGPSFATSLTDTEVLVGRNFTLSCSATGNPPPTISWSRRGRLLPIGSQTIAISPEGDKLTLPFIDTSDSGEYTCTAENVVTDQGSLVRKSVSSTAQLIVIVPPVAVAETPNVIVVRGQTALLRCNSTGIPAPTFTWSRNGQQMLTGRYRVQEGTLEIANSEVEDADQYICLATNKGGYSNSSVILFVHYPPVVTEHPADQAILLNTTVIFHCRVRSDPPSLMSWSKDGMTVNDSRRIGISRSHNAIQLSIVDVVSNDAGRYVCMAQNTIATSNTSAVLQVIVPPIVTSPSQVIHQLAKNTAWLPCIVTGNPTPIVEWFRNNSRLADGPRWKVLSSGTLLIHSVTRNDAGMYRCVATNRGGSDAVDIMLDVQFKPVIEAPPANQTVVVGSPANFTCIVTGNPHPQVTWLKGGIPLGDTKKQTVNGGLVAILSTSEADTDSYTCLASNIVTNRTETIDLSVSASAHLTVLVPPSAYTSTLRVTVEKGQKAFLHCNATGIPSPKFSWSKDGEDEEHSKRHIIRLNGLEVSKTREVDAGNFTCTASNTVGSSNVTISLDVQYRPTIRNISESGWRVRNSPTALHCIADGNPLPVYTWTWKGHNVTNSTRGMIIHQNGRMLIVKRVNDRYSGRFHCSVTNSIGSRLGIIKIQPTDLPRVVVPDALTTKEYAKVVLPCNVTGSPTPAIQWLRNGTYLPTQYVRSDGMLDIENVSRSDNGGVYTCEATNLAGRSTGNITLNVLYPPRILSGPGDILVTADPSREHAEPGNITFSCIVDGNEAPTTLWFSKSYGSLSANGPLIEVEGDDSPPTIVLSEDGTELTIQNVDRAAFGDYACKATNSQGSDFSWGWLRSRG